MFFTDMVPLHHYLFHFLHTCIHFCHCVRRAAFHSSVTVSDLRTAKVEIFVGISVTALGSVRVSRAAYGALIGRSSSLPVFNYYLYVHPQLGPFINTRTMHLQGYLIEMYICTYTYMYNNIYFIYVYIYTVFMQYSYVYISSIHAMNNIALAFLHFHTCYGCIISVWLSVLHGPTPQKLDLFQSTSTQKLEHIHPGLYRSTTWAGHRGMCLHEMPIAGCLPLDLLMPWYGGSNLVASELWTSTSQGFGILFVHQRWECCLEETRQQHYKPGRFFGSLFKALKDFIIVSPLCVRLPSGSLGSKCRFMFTVLRARCTQWWLSAKIRNEAGGASEVPACICLKIFCIPQKARC